MKKKTNPIIITIIILINFLVIPTVYAFYFANYKSSIISRFIINGDLSESYVRATYLTYWIDPNSCISELDMTTCNISGKSSWNINDTVINSDWILLEDGYYYYKTSIDSNDINKSNIKDSNIALINSELSLEELMDEQFIESETIPQYEIIYEFIENNGIESAWNITYENGLPELINNS